MTSTDGSADQWLQVFTDRSYIENQANVGAGVYSDLVSFYAAAGHHRFVFDGEKGASRCNELKARTKEKQWSVELSDIADWPRIEVVASFGLRTGHDCLTKHLHKLGVYTQPTCPLCNLQEEVRKTHLIRCPALKTTEDPPDSVSSSKDKQESQRYWEARRQLMS
ncbi:unnamed protein product [Rodentolepis nana]|uniref:XPGI domain-containing protein n=1 Tax=Rodentolepis nana TaxID=102285 RepID=A0A0R3THE0_RODNA|nr:unnamed protein product [Rodentolepis nana]